MLRLLQAGLHSPEHVLFINTMMEVSNSRFSAHIQHGGGGVESNGLPAASLGDVGGIRFMRLPGHGSERQQAVQAFSGLDPGLGLSCVSVPRGCCWC